MCCTVMPTTKGWAEMTPEERQQTLERWRFLQEALERGNACVERKAEGKS